VPRGAVDLTARVGTVTLANPVMMASGSVGHGVELEEVVDLAAPGAVVVKSLSAEAWAGNPPPRLAPLPAGMLNSIGLENPGVDAWLEGALPRLAARGATVVASVWGFTGDDYRRVAARLAAALADPDRPGVGSVVAIEANISCPNIEDRRQMFAHSEAGAALAIGAVVEGLAEGRSGAAEGSSRAGLPVWAKLSPNVTDLPAIAGAALGAGASGLTLINTVMGLALDPASGRALLGAGGGGLSGPAVHPVAVRAVFDCRAAFGDVPIVGVGGISSGVDAAELLAAGADAVQVGTATFADPRACLKILRQLETWCAHHGVRRVEELVGKAHG
jgi:dihydroorotate dehydrogenase (NAD+) catalytic subunit